jgi:hypothetical protein
MLKERIQETRQRFQYVAESPLMREVDVSAVTASHESLPESSLPEGPAAPAVARLAAAGQFSEGGWASKLYSSGLISGRECRSDYCIQGGARGQ